MLSIQDRLQRTCLLICSPSGRTGSGYLVAKGYAGTAAHVVAEWPDHVPFDVVVGWGQESREAEATVVFRDLFQDVAILSIQNCDDLMPLPIAPAPSQANLWDGYCFPKVAFEGGAATGIPLSGEIRSINAGSKGGPLRMLVSCREARGNAAMYGCSGGPVAVNGGLAGHIVEQFTDPDDPTKSVLSFLKVAPIETLLAHLPPGAQYERLSKRRADRVALSEADLAPLLAWCDRDAVIEHINNWLEDKSAGNVGLLCLVGSADNRETLLLNRFAEELCEQVSMKIPAQAVHVHKEAGHDVRQLRRVSHDRLGIGVTDNLSNAEPFLDGAHLVLLCHYCDCQHESSKQLALRLSAALEWLSDITLAPQRLVLVISVRFSTLLGTTEMDKVQKAFRQIRKDKQQAERMRLLLTGPVMLESYRAENVRKWAANQRVQQCLGATAAQINDARLNAWFGTGTLSYTQLLERVTEIHQQPTIPSGDKHVQ